VPLLVTLSATDANWDDYVKVLEACPSSIDFVLYTPSAKTVDAYLSAMRVKARVLDKVPGVVLGYSKLVGMMMTITTSI
jgi:hypothetical protein